MDMAVLKQTPVQVNIDNYSSNQKVAKPDELALNKPIAANKSEAGKNQSQSEDKGKEELTCEDAHKLTEHLNKFIVTIDSDLKFELHEETQRLIVRFINKQDNQVIKEFPPHELLDTLAAIRDYVGLLLDKKV